MQIHELPQLATPEASDFVAVDTGSANYKVPLSNLMTNVANNLTTTEAGYALDARQGKVLNDNINGLAGNIATIETSPTASAHNSGDYIVYNGILYKVTANITAGGTLVVGTNITPITVMEALIAQGAAPILIKNIEMTTDGSITSPPATIDFTYHFPDKSTVGYTPIAYIPTRYSYCDFLTYYKWIDAGTSVYGSTFEYDVLEAGGFSYTNYSYTGLRKAWLTIVFVPDSMIR